MARRYTDEEKAEAVRLVRQLRSELGTERGAVKMAADQLGCSVTSVANWVSQADTQTSEIPPPPIPIAPTPPPPATPIPTPPSNAPPPGWWLASDGKWYPPQPVSPSASAARSVGEKLVLGGAAALIIGAFMPWASAGPFTVNGTSGDGRLTLVFGIAVAWLAWARRASGFVLALLILAAGVSFYDLFNIGGMSGDTGLFSVSVGIGLIVSAAGSAAGLAGWWKQKGNQ